MVLPVRVSLSQALGGAIARAWVFLVEPGLEGDPVSRRDGQQGIRRPGCRRLLDHDTGFGPGVGIFLSRYPGDDLTITGQRLMHEVELVAASPRCHDRSH